MSPSKFNKYIVETVNFNYQQGISKRHTFQKIAEKTNYSPLTISNIYYNNYNRQSAKVITVNAKKGDKILINVI